MKITKTVQRLVRAALPLTTFMQHARLLMNAYRRSGYWQRFMDFIRDKRTPFLVINLDQVATNYQLFKDHLPTQTKIYYPVKAHPDKPLIQRLITLGSSFEVASIYELDAVVSLGVKGKDISYGNPVKKQRDIRYAYAKGVRYFVCDSKEDMLELSVHAPRSNVIFRLAMETASALMPMTKKFGIPKEEIFSLIHLARSKGLNAYGLSFHVGSQQHNLSAWEEALQTSHEIFHKLQKEGIRLHMLNLGGGFPLPYLNTSSHPLGLYLKNISTQLQRFFDAGRSCALWVEPGRAMVGNAGILVSEVILRTKRHDGRDWLYMDTGIFGGLMEAFNETIKYPIWAETCQPYHLKPYVLAGPTCDGMDVIYENFCYLLPETIQPMDRLYFMETGAYTHTYSAINFNGYPALKTHYLA